MNFETAEETVVTVQYAKVLTITNEEKSFMSAAIVQGRDEESQLKSTCKNLAVGDCIFLLTFNLLYMLRLRQAFWPFADICWWI
jgi:hypothetical protein